MDHFYQSPWIFYALGALELLLSDEEQDYKIRKKAPLQENPNLQETITLSVDNDRQKVIQPSIVKMLPTIPENTTTFLKQQGYAAQCSRRTETGYISGGVTVPQIRAHLFQMVPNLQQFIISLSATR